jgi:hypothetical protein
MGNLKRWWECDGEMVKHGIGDGEEMVVWESECLTEMEWDERSDEPPRFG